MKTVREPPEPQGIYSIYHILVQMKPATIGLFTFLASFIIYSIIGIFLVGIINSNCYGICNNSNETYNYEIAIAVAIAGSILTGYLAYAFERWPPVTTSPAT